MYARLVGTDPAFLSEWLPATIVVGAGGGITFPALSSAAVASAPGGRFATATGLNSVARQLGAALGVAVLVAILGAPDALGAPPAFDDGWMLAVAIFAALALGTLAVRPDRAVDRGGR